MVARIVPEGAPDGGGRLAVSAVRARHMERRQPCPAGEALAVSVASRSAMDGRFRGGDLFDVLVRSNGSTSVLLADVSSKGRLGVAHAGLLRAAFLRAAERSHDPARILRELNGVRLDAPGAGLSSSFASAFVATIERNGSLLRYASAGHDPALILHPQSGRGPSHHRLAPTGPVIGIIREASYIECVEAFDAGDALLLATDGFTECRSALDHVTQFGSAGILAALEHETTRTIAGAAALVARKADEFTGGRYRDDATVALVRRRANDRAR